jgi:hypothetical protein
MNKTCTYLHFYKLFFFEIKTLCWPKNKYCSPQNLYTMAFASAGALEEQYQKTGKTFPSAKYQGTHTGCSYFRG